MSGRTVRLLSLVVPSALAAKVVHPREQILHAVVPVLVMLWVVMIGALAMRFVEARDRKARRVGPRRTAEGGAEVDRRHREGKQSAWRAIDILTPTGVAVMWLGAAAMFIAGETGWASMSVVGVLGLGTSYVVTAWTAIVACGTDRWRGAEVERALVPRIAVEGDPVREEVKLRGVRIPPGMRLFITGRAMRFGAVSRYALGADRSGGEVVLASEIGPAQRGEHRAPPLRLWLADTLGLTRSPVEHRAGAELTVTPKLAPVDGVQQLLGTGGDAAVASPNQLPTEGTFKIREYVPGDDTRRIHWVRSAQQDQLIVRLPDEVPPADPAVRIVLDNELPGMEGLSTRAPDQLLDAMVRIWLGIGKALAEKGVRVTLVTAAARGAAMKRVEKPMWARGAKDALKLGTDVTWQASIALDQLLGGRGVRQIVVSARPRQVSAEVHWVVVPEAAWTAAEPVLPEMNAMTHPFPSGSPENRGSARQRERKRVERMWQDRLVLTHLVGWTDWLKLSGGHVARPRDGRVTLGVIP